MSWMCYAQPCISCLPLLCIFNDFMTPACLTQPFAHPACLQHPFHTVASVSGCPNKLSGVHEQAWNLTGDAFTHNPGEKPWISEMYGYSFGCSAADVWHKTDHSSMLYPGYSPSSIKGAARTSSVCLNMWLGWCVRPALKPQ